MYLLRCPIKLPLKHTLLTALYKNALCYADPNIKIPNRETKNPQSNSEKSCHMRNAVGKYSNNLQRKKLSNWNHRNEWMLDTAEIIFLKLASSAVRGLEFVRVKRRMDRAGHCRKKFWFFSSISHKHLTILATHMGLYASWSGSFSPQWSKRNWVGWEGQFLLSSNFCWNPPSYPLNQELSHWNNSICQRSDFHKSLLEVLQDYQVQKWNRLFGTIDIWRCSPMRK